MEGEVYFEGQYLLSAFVPLWLFFANIKYEEGEVCRV
jgi:hypothetical protein